MASKEVELTNLAEYASKVIEGLSEDASDVLVAKVENFVVAVRQEEATARQGWHEDWRDVVATGRASHVIHYTPPEMDEPSQVPGRAHDRIGQSPGRLSARLQQHPQG